MVHVVAGDVALAGDPDTVQQAGANLKGRTVGSDVYTNLISAASSLGGQSGAAVSVERILTMIQASSAPANLTQTADHALGSKLASYGGRMEDLARRAKQARDDLAAATSDVATAQDDLDAYTGFPTNADDARHHRNLGNAVDAAEDRVASTEQRLRALDEERRGMDSSTVGAIDTQQALYVAARNAMPTPPRVSAQVRVTVNMPDGSIRGVTAVELAQLKDPQAIRAVWDAMTTEQRQQLITDLPLLIGNLDGIPLQDRNTANVITAKAYRDELEQQIATLTLMQRQDGMDGLFADKITDLRGEVKSIDAILGDRNDKYADEKNAHGERFGEYKVYDENGVRSYRDGTILVGFNPMRDSYVTFQGTLDPVTGDVPAWMEQVSVVVPGTNSRLASFTADLDRGKDLIADSGARSGYFTWHGAPMPQFELPDHISEAAERGFADVAAPRLASFTNNLRLPEGTDVVPIGHSYGGMVLATAESLGLDADRVVYVAPAGLGHETTTIDEFPNTSDVPHFVLQARNDMVVGWNQGVSGLGLGHGTTNPLDAPGIIRLETGYLDRNSPEAGTIEAPGGIETHSTPFAPESTSMRNITNVVEGEPVSIYHENDVERLRVGGRVPRSVEHEIEDSGAAKPEELISPLTLKEVQ